jgi:hypothetical protein
MLDGVHYDAFSRRQGISLVSSWLFVVTISACFQGHTSTPWQVTAADMACVATALLVTPARAFDTSFMWPPITRQLAGSDFTGGSGAAPSSGGLSHGWWAAWDSLQDPSSHHFSTGVTQAKALQVMGSVAESDVALNRFQSVLVSQMRNLMTPNTRSSRKIFFAKFDATGDLALLRHPKVLLMLGQLVVASKRADNKCPSPPRSDAKLHVHVFMQIPRCCACLCRQQLSDSFGSRCCQDECCRSTAQERVWGSFQVLRAVGLLSMMKSCEFDVTQRPLT